MTTAGRLTPGSVQHRISLMKVGDAHWIETTSDQYARVQQTWNLPRTRRVPALKDFVLACSVWTAVGSVVGAAPRILVRVERVK